MIELLHWHVLGGDLTLPPGEQVTLFDTRVAIPEQGWRAIRVSLQGRAYTRAFTDPGLTLQLTCFDRRLIALADTIEITAGEQIDPVAAAGRVQFHDLPAMTIPESTLLQRGGTRLLYQTTADVEVIDGFAELELMAQEPGKAGNAPVDTAMMLTLTSEDDRQLYAGFVTVDALTGGADVMPGPDTRVVKVISAAWNVTSRRGVNQIPVLIHAVNLSQDPWTLCGFNSALPGGWGFDCLVEDLHWMEAEPSA